MKENVVKKNIKHKDYKNVLSINKQLYHEMKAIRSQNHQIGSYEMKKISCLPISVIFFKTE